MAIVFLSSQPHCCTQSSSCAYFWKSAHKRLVSSRATLAAKPSCLTMHVFVHSRWSNAFASASRTDSVRVAAWPNAAVHDDPIADPSRATPASSSYPPTRAFTAPFPIVVVVARLIVTAPTLKTNASVNPPLNNFVNLVVVVFRVVVLASKKRSPTPPFSSAIGVAPYADTPSVIIVIVVVVVVVVRASARPSVRAFVRECRVLHTNDPASASPPEVLNVGGYTLYII